MGKVTAIATFIIMNFFLIAMIWSIPSEAQNPKEVPCYDRYGNEIQEVTCIQEGGLVMPLTVKWATLLFCEIVILAIVITEWRMNETL